LQQPLSQLQKDSLPLSAHRDSVSGLLYSPKPLDCSAAEVAAAQASAASSCPTVFLGSFRMPLDPELTEHEDVEAVFGFMEQHPDSSRFEMQMHSRAYRCKIKYVLDVDTALLAFVVCLL
jgi:hypothetical protein